MSAYAPCDCGDANRCFRCAIDFVVCRFGGDPNCECRKSAGPFCIPCEVRADRWNDYSESALPAFQAANPPYWELARLYAGYAGSEIVARKEGIMTIGRNLEQGALRLLASARTDPLAFDAALFMVAECVRHDLKVPKPLREWAFYAMTGRIERPKMNGKYPPALNWRNKVIVGLVEDVMQICKIHATSSDEEGGESACKAVAEGLRLLRLQPDSYSAIRRIWRSRDKPLEEPVFLRTPPTE